MRVFGTSRPISLFRPLLQHARPLPDREPYPRPVFDCLSEQLASLVEIVAGVQHALDLCAVLRPLFDLVEIARVPLPHAIAWRDFSLFAASEGDVIAKETKHFASSVRPSRIGIGSGETAARPSVASSMDAPLL